MFSNHEHLWIEGPELPRLYGASLSRICTECGIYERYDWQGGHLAWNWFVNAEEEFEELYANR